MFNIDETYVIQTINNTECNGSSEFDCLNIQECLDFVNNKLSSFSDNDSQDEINRYIVYQIELQRKLIGI